MAEGKAGKIIKVVGFGPDMAAPMEITSSRQLLDDPFTEVSGYGMSLMHPPYKMESLVVLAEALPAHGAALAQKVVDVVADGPKFVATSASTTEEDLVAVVEWFESLTGEFTPLEIITAVQDDYETLGWGMFEAVRDMKGIVRRIYHVPAQTIRAHRDNVRLAQMRMGQVVWFKKWGNEDQFNFATGNKASANTGWEKLASELLVFRSPNRRSSWYGVPKYVTALGHIAMAIAARDYNVLFFENAREPRHLIVVTGLEEDVEGIIDDIAEQLSLQYKDPHRNVLLPVTGDADIKIEKMGYQQNDMHYAKLIDTAENSILLAHRIPPDRLGLSKRGFLGGNVASVLNKIYRDGVVSPAQQLLESRLTRFIQTEYEKASGKKLDFRVDFERLDVSDEASKTTTVSLLVKNNMISINEGRMALNYPHDDRYGDMTQAEFLQVVKLGPGDVTPTEDLGPTGLGGDIPSADTDDDDDDDLLTETALKANLAEFKEYLDDKMDSLDLMS